jgi:DNA excision repair protein ERCC-8
MNSYLLNRSTGTISQHELRRYALHRQLLAIQASDLRFDGNLHQASQQASLSSNGSLSLDEKPIAHHNGVNALTIDRFEGRYLLSGGADATISLWDLQASTEQTSDGTKGSPTLHSPLATSRKGSTHKFGVTDISYYPFDSLAFLSSSYDHNLCLSSSETLTPAATFDLDSAIYAHAVSPIASHLLVACATQLPAIRLVDLRSGASAHSLAGHVGAVLTVGWSPKDEHVLASGGVDGTIRLWDVRRSAAALGVLDLEDSIGVLGYDGKGIGARPVSRGKAHMGACNGLAWSDCGRWLVSTGHDEKIRVWSMAEGRNTLASFGPVVRNRGLGRLVPCLVPSNLVGSGHEMLFFPNEKEILQFEMLEGTMIKRLRVPGISRGQGAPNAKVALKNKVLDLAWRSHNVELYSGHGDGTIRAWKPYLPEDKLADDEDREEEIQAENERKRKREALESVYQDLTRKKMIFS